MWNQAIDEALAQALTNLGSVAAPAVIGFVVVVGLCFFLVFLVVVVVFMLVVLIGLWCL